MENNIIHLLIIIIIIFSLTYLILLNIRKIITIKNYILDIKFELREY